MSRKNFVKHFGTALLATLVLLFGADAFGFCSCAVQATSAPSQEVYLSDLAWESATHGDQANYQVFKDQTFTSGNKIGGEQPLKKISLLVNGVETEFNKGLSTCASSVIVYNLSGKNAIKFSTYIGVDYAKMGSYTSTIGNPEDQRGGIVNSIQVLVDDVELYNSNGQVNPSMNATLVSVDIPSNATKLTLKCEQGFKNWGDEVDYADAKLTIAQPVNSGTDLQLSDIAWESATHGDQANYQVFKDQTFTSGNKIGGEQPLKKISLLVNGVETEFNKGLSTCASSTIIYNLDGLGATKFSAYVGVDYAKLNSYTSTINSPANQQGGVVDGIQILADGAVLYDSTGPVNPSMNASLVSVNIPVGAKKLILKCEKGFQNWGDEVDYADAKLTVTMPELGAGWVEVDNIDPAVTYTGAWNLVTQPATRGGSTQSTEVIGAKASFAFTGTGVQWIGKTNELFGKAKIYLDGALFLEQDCGKSNSLQKKIFSIVGLPTGQHTIEIECVSNHIELDAFAYTTDTAAITATGFELSQPLKAAYVGEQKEISVRALRNSDYVMCNNLAFASSNSAVASINASGLFTALTGGNVTITITGLGHTQNYDVAIRQNKLRMNIDSQNPLFFHHLYKTSGEKTTAGNSIQGFWDTLSTSLTTTVKARQALLFHFGEIQDTPATRSWYENRAEETVSGNIPFFLMISNSYTEQHFSNDWLAYMYNKYPNMMGVVYSENHASVWQNHGGYRSAQIVSKLDLSSQYGGYVIFCDTNNYNEYMESTLNNAALMKSAKENSSNFIMIGKYTSQWSQAGYNSYASVTMGAWLTGYSGNWGSLIDSWSWGDLHYYNDAFSTTRTARKATELCKSPFSFPELIYPIRMLSESLSGASVFSFEHPIYSTAVADSGGISHTTPAFDNAIVKAMEYIVENKSASRDEVLNKTKIVFDASNGTLNKTAEAGVNLVKALYGDENVNHKGDRSDPNEMLLMQLSGRYGFLPSIPSLATAADKQLLTAKGIQIIDKNSVLSNFKKNTLQQTKDGTDVETQNAVQAYFNAAYPKVSSGNAYVQKSGNTWFTYNNRWHDNTKQSASLENAVFCNGINVEFDPFTYIVLKESTSSILVNFNNYFVDKSEIWNPNSVSYNPNWDDNGNKGFADYVLANYVPKQITQDNTFKDAKIVFKGLEQAPIITVLNGLENQYNAPVGSWNATTKEYTVTIRANGYLNFTVNK